MKVNGSATVAAPVPRVWDALRDPAVLGRVIPGCERFEEVGPDTYAITVRAGVASIKGTYAGTVTLSDPEPPNAFTLRARGQGAPGTIEATVRVRLSANGDGTRVDYDADAVVGGMIAGVGQRMLAGVTRKTAGEFFAAVESALVRPAPAAEIAPRPRPVRAVSGADAWAMMSAFAAGGFVALAGVALGWALARRARHR